MRRCKDKDFARREINVSQTLRSSFDPRVGPSRHEGAWVSNVVDVRTMPARTFVSGLIALAFVGQGGRQREESIASRGRNLVEERVVLNLFQSRRLDDIVRVISKADTSKLDGCQRPLGFIPIVTESDSQDSQMPANLSRWCKQEVCDGFGDFVAIRV
jgi:hypothetical protein